MGYSKPLTQPSVEKALKDLFFKSTAGTSALSQSDCGDEPQCGAVDAVGFFLMALATYRSLRSFHSLQQT